MMIQFSDINAVCDKLISHESFILLTHKNPDGDALGSTAALARLLIKAGKKVKILLPEAPMQRLRFILGELDFYTPENAGESLISPYIVCLDCASSSRLGKLEEKFGQRVDLSIDHHISNTPFAKCTYTKADASAASEIVYSIANEFVARNIIDKTDADISFPLYAGIASDTGNFKYANTSADTLRICAELIETGIDTALISRLLFDTFPINKLRAEAIGVQRLEVFANSKAAIISVPRELLEREGLTYEDFDDVVNVARKVEGVEIGAYVRVSDTGDYKISLRSNDYVDVAAICAKHAGGGHTRAAGCNISAGSIEEAVKIIKKDIEEALKNN